MESSYIAFKGLLGYLSPICYLIMSLVVGGGGGGVAGVVAARVKDSIAADGVLPPLGPYGI